MAFVYAVGSSVSCPPYCSYLKIGRSTDPFKRLASHRIGSPVPLTYAALFRVKLESTAIDLELECHAHFRSRKVHGEWFNVPLGDLVDFVKHNADANGYLVSIGLGGRMPKPPSNPTISEIAKRFAYMDRGSI